MQQALHIGFIGAGNVATHLAKALQKEPCIIDWVWSRSNASASMLATSLQCNVIDALDSVLPSVDLIIISVPDDAVAEVSTQLKLEDPETAVVHTSGSLGSVAISAHIKNTGVFYPLQTFSKDKQLSLKGIPFCIEAVNPTLHGQLNFLVDLLGGVKVDTTLEQRVQLHLAAVIACNFSNFLYSCSEEILENAGLSFKLLHPLIKETTQKAIERKTLGSTDGTCFSWRFDCYCQTS